MNDLYLLGALPWWLVALVAAGAAALLVHRFIVLRERLSRGQTTFLTVLRLCVYAGLIFFLLGPALIDRRITKLRRPLTLLIALAGQRPAPRYVYPTEPVSIG